jgi:dephospho-CoA kinase
VKVVCVAGMPGCGKEEFLQVADEVGFSVVRMGDTVREEARERGIGQSDEAIGGFAHREREVHGYGVWAERTLPRVRGERVVIDGLRGSKELEVFRKGLGQGVEVVAVHAAPRVRFERLRQRNRSDAPATWEEYLVRDTRELRWGLGDVIATADYMIVNEGDLPAFRARAREVLESVLGGSSHVP